MELTSINLQAKTFTNDLPSKTSVTSDNVNRFSNVYNDVSNKTKNDAAQNNVQAASQTNNLKDGKTDTSNYDSAEDKNVEANTTKDDKDLSNLIEMLLMSQGTNQNIINLLNSSGAINTQDIKDMLINALNDNLESSNSLNVAAVNQTGIANDEITKIFSFTNLVSNESIDKLAANIANKLSNDTSFKNAILAELSANIQEPSASSIAKDDSLKEQIISQMKAILNEGTSVSSNKTSNNNSDDILTQAPTSIKDPTIATLDTASSDNSNLSSKNSGNSTTDSKLNNSSSDKEDKLLKQLIDSNGSKNNSDNVSDKIANVVNRFETLKSDNQPLVENKLTLNKATLNEDVIKTVQYMETNDIKELSVKVIPKDLGEIIIRLSMDNGVMKANITAANKDTYNLLNAQLSSISSELSKQNMAIQSFSLSLYNGDNFLFNGNGSANDNGKQQNKNNIKVNTVEESDSQNENYIENNNAVDLLA